MFTSRYPIPKGCIIACKYKFNHNYISPQKQDLTSVITTPMRMPSMFETNTSSPKRKPFQKKKKIILQVKSILTRLKFLTPSNIPKKSSLIDVITVACRTPSFSDVSSSVYQAIHTHLKLCS